MGRTSRRRRLGQHLLVDGEVADLMLDAACLRTGCSVFEIGSGTGFLTARLCRKASSVVSYEVDPLLYAEASKNLADYSNLKLVLGDAFEADAVLDTVVSSLPFSESRNFITWLSTKRFSCAVVILQSAFVSKLTTPPGSQRYRAVSALSQALFTLTPLRRVPAKAFRPPPKVDSVVVSIDPKAPPVDRSSVGWLHKLFSFRRRKLATALKSMSRHGGRSPLEGYTTEIGQKRVEELGPQTLLALAHSLAQSGGVSVGG